jgi:Zn-dependent M16 (insulinase) family peptidase
MPSKPSHTHSVGQTYHGFQVTKSLEIPEINCHLYELVHLPTNASVLHIANDDPENLFCLSFQTLPEKSDGVAHILEHTVLCGSKKFPVKDPFFAMTRRSLNTFMNALTGSDFTCYPAASQVPKDFYNLLAVYLDAVFHPILNPMSFMQEGHRLEFENPLDPSTPLLYKGIVFNEMKGALSAPGAHLAEEMHAALFPNNTYGINSGGNPKIIPTLTYDQLVDFHHRFYHPSRCLFFFYGNMNLEDHLDFIAKNALEGVEKQPPLPSIPPQPRFREPRRLVSSYPISPEEETDQKTYISFGWVTCHIIEQEELLALQLLEIILLDTDASPLKKALLKSGYCKLVSSHIDTDVNECPLMITLRGCNPENADACEALLRVTLEEIAKGEISLQMIENAIHQLEFHRSEITGDHAPFGLSLFMRSALLKQHKVPAEEGLKIHSLFEKVRQKALEQPNYFGHLITKYLLDNPHFVRLVMIPDKELTAKDLEEEKENLGSIFAKLTEKDIESLISQAKRLNEFQKKQEHEDKEILPQVTLEDVPKFSRDFLLTKEKIGSLQVYHHNCFTNQILYADLIFNLPEISNEDLPLVRLFTYLLTQLGAGGRTYAENLEYIQAHTGGIGASLSLNLKAQDYNQLTPSLKIQGKALHRKAPKLISLIYDFVTSADFSDTTRLTELLHKHYTVLETNLNQNAMQYALNLSASGLDISSYIVNEWYGLDYFFKIREIVQNLHSKIGLLSDKFKFFQKYLLCPENPDFVVTCDAGLYDEMKSHGFYELSNLPTAPSKPWKPSYHLPKIEPQGRIITSPVAFTGKVFKTIPYIHPDNPALAIAACLFDNLTLHQRLREQGGAYGGGAVSNSLSGNFYFYAYRDPNIYSTIEAFQDAILEVIKGKFTEKELEEAKLEIIQSLDDPVAPGTRGIVAYSWLREGKTLEIRQAFRDRLLNLTSKDVIGAVKKYVQPEKGTIVSFAGRGLLERENALLKPPLTIMTLF